MSAVTSSSLLARLRDPADAGSWDRFYSFYAPLIMGFCRRNGCSEAMAHDVLQESMMQILKILPGFEYDRHKGEFRSFLLKVVHGRLKDAYKRERLYARSPSGSGTPWMHAVADPSPEVPCADWDALWDANLLRCALQRVEARVEPLTYRSFVMHELEGAPVQRIQQELGIPNRNAVYQHRNRLLRLLRQEVETLRVEVGE